MSAETNNLVELRFYEIDDPAVYEQKPRLLDALKNKEPCARLVSEGSYQLRHAMDDLALCIARERPELCGASYPVQLAWSEGVLGTAPVLEALLPRSETLRRAYPVSALRGGELLSRVRASSGTSPGARLVYLAGPAEVSPQNKPAQGQPFDLLGDEERGAGLAVRVDPFETQEPAVPVDALPILGKASADAVPAFCPRALLAALAEDEASRAAQDFRERAWFLLGRVVRNGDSRDLAIVVEDALEAVQTTSTASALLFTEDTKLALREQIAQRKVQGIEQRIVGWVHTHDMDALSAESDAASETPPTVLGPDEPEGDDTHRSIDGRFFSQFDVLMHRKDFSAASIALVLDAAAARRRSELERCFACFGTVSGIVVERGLYLS